MPSAWVADRWSAVVIDDTRRTVDGGAADYDVPPDGNCQRGRSPLSGQSPDDDDH